MTSGAKKIALVIPTLNARARWSECLAAISIQSPQPDRRLVIDSSSTDDTARLAIEAGFEVREISRSQFNHGGTRQWAVELVEDCEFVVFLTQDAVLASTESLARVIACFDDANVAISYGRQLPHPDAKAMAAHARLFNYGDVSQHKDLAAQGELGPKVFFSSNSFAAYRRSTLMELGGFRSDLILGEDAEYAARAILAGYVNVYCADALVYHSHEYTAAETFWRYFDTGVFHARNGWLQRQFGTHGGEGLRFVNSELRYLASHAPLEIPRSVVHTFAKVIGYRLGRLERMLPVGIKRRLSMSPAYWRSEL